MRTLLVALACLTPALLPAQTVFGFVSGSVSGTVTCTDTNLPAHYASIALEPVREVSAIPAAPEPKSTKAESPAMISVIRTHLDGTFQIAKVRPGRYYVVVQNPGYLSPASQFTQVQINHPTAALQEAIAKVVPILTITANANSTLNVALQRAASISGNVRFDDGSPAAGLFLKFERKEADGKFVDVALDADGPDDQGHFRASGVPTGEYRVSTDLSVRDLQVTGVFGGGHGSVSSYADGISIYYGDTFHQKEAKIVKIEGGESITADITIPASKIHSLTGALVDARTGHVINDGKVTLAEPNTEEPFTTTKVQADEPIYHFEYVPEGDYTVRVKDAQDVNRVAIPYAPGSFGTAKYKETVLKQYQPYEVPLKVQTDQAGLNLPLTPVKPGTPLPPTQ